MILAARSTKHFFHLMVDGDHRGGMGQNGGVVDDRVSNRVVDGCVNNRGGNQLGCGVDHMANF